MTRTKTSKPKNTASSLGGPRSPPLKMWESGEPAASPPSHVSVSRLEKQAGSRAYPALQLAPNHMGNNADPGFAIVKAGDGGEVLSARVVKNLRILAGDFLQGFEAVGR